MNSFIFFKRETWYRNSNSYKWWSSDGTNFHEDHVSGRDGDKASGQEGNTCAFNFTGKSALSSMLPYESSISNYCPNALLKLRFWPLFWNLLLLLPPPDRCPLKLRFPSRCPLKLLFPSRCPRKPRLPSRCPLKPRYPSRGRSSSGCSVATDSCQRRESCHFSCGEIWFYLLWFLLNLILKSMRKTVSLPFL